MEITELKLTKIPIGIESIDFILNGGIPSGSLAVLLSEQGAGDFEFAVTTMANQLTLFDLQDKNSLLLQKVCYISFARSCDDILREILFSFPEYYKIIQKSIQNGTFEFKDFSEIYLESTMQNRTFRSLIPEYEKKENKMVDLLSEYLNKNGNNCLIILDSITVLVRYFLQYKQWNDFISFLRIMQRVSKVWGGLVYFILNKGVLYECEEQEILDCMDCILLFQWEKIGTLRKRSIFLPKMRGICTTMEDEDIFFQTRIDNKKGLMVSNQQRIRGKA